jgi:hypothetical protein
VPHCILFHIKHIFQAAMDINCQYNKNKFIEMITPFCFYQELVLPQPVVLIIKSTIQNNNGTTDGSKR